VAFACEALGDADASNLCGGDDEDQGRGGAGSDGVDGDAPKTGKV
jgi:hypothetical protein